jgi:hypothetical protein
MEGKELVKRKEFKNSLDEMGISYKDEGDKIIISSQEGRKDIDLNFLDTLPEGIIFNNLFSVDLRHLKTIPSGTVFSNGLSVYLNFTETLSEGISFYNRGNVYLNSLKTLPNGITFKNSGSVYLNSIKSIQEEIVFSNGGGVYLESLFGGWISDWLGYIWKIKPNRLVNKMIKDGLLDRR